MRPKISACKRIATTLRYNEQKVTGKQATCLLAVNFIKDAARLTMEDKLARFTRLMQLNKRITTSNLHISLNFHPSEQLSDEKMKAIAKTYMKEIGFGKQPYLVYRHHDAGHPHMHIISTHIRPDGSPIPLYNIGRNQSEKARQEIETQFGLVSSEKKDKVQRQKVTTGVQRVKYGESPMAPAISDVLELAMGQYKFTTLDEFNALLRLYNVQACPGKENSGATQHRGLLYRALDKDGNYIGVPLKASFFDCRPTLGNLEKKFILHRSQRQQHEQTINTHILWALRQKPTGLEDFQQKLERERIRLVIRQDKQGAITHIAYVDFSTKCVFSDDALDKRCGLDEIQKLADRQHTQTEQESQTQALHHAQHLSPSSQRV